MVTARHVSYPSIAELPLYNFDTDHYCRSVDFTVILASPDFVGKPAIARHRLVNGLLKEEFEQMGLHALSLRLKTPTEAEKEGLSAEP